MSPLRVRHPSRWVHRESNLMFTLSSDKDQGSKEKIAFAFSLDQCKWTFIVQWAGAALSVAREADPAMWSHPPGDGVLWAQ